MSVNIFLYGIQSYEIILYQTAKRNGNSNRNQLRDSSASQAHFSVTFLWCSNISFGTFFKFSNLFAHESEKIYSTVAVKIQRFAILPSQRTHRSLPQFLVCQSNTAVAFQVQATSPRAAWRAFLGVL